MSIWRLLPISSPLKNDIAFCKRPKLYRPPLQIECLRLKRFSSIPWWNVIFALGKPTPKYKSANTRKLTPAQRYPIVNGRHKRNNKNPMRRSEVAERGTTIALCRDNIWLAVGRNKVAVKCVLSMINRVNDEQNQQPVARDVAMVSKLRDAAGHSLQEGG